MKLYKDTTIEVADENVSKDGEEEKVQNEEPNI